MSILSDRLRELRGDTSQAEMARQLKMQRPQWIKYETGKTVPGADILAEICRVHACSADWLLGLKDSKIAAANFEKDTPQKTPAVNLDELRATATQLAEESAALAGTIKKLKKML